MTKQISLKQGILSVLFWSIISAAFIGPGTVTTAAKAGAGFGYQLLWALLFSTIGTIILQEAAARITIASGKSLGEIIAEKYKEKGYWVKLLLFVAIAFGCAAYQAGNMLGAISGIKLLGDVPVKMLTIILGVICAGLLWLGNFKIIAHFLGMVVAFMGAAFIYVAGFSDFSTLQFSDAVLPSLPEGSTLLAIGLVGTTIVPYNLFLASGISKGQAIGEMRLGLGLAVLIGGIISMAILFTGTQIQGAFSFEALATAVGSKTGQWGAMLFSLGLFAAGMSSSITSPLAAAVTARSMFSEDGGDWGVKSRNFRLVWGVILLVGLLFGVSGIKPVPAIIMAQALNGALLPIVAGFLFLIVNDKTVLPDAYRNKPIANIFMLLVVTLSSFLGINNILKAGAKAGGFTLEPMLAWGISAGLAVGISLGLVYGAFFKGEANR